MTFYIYSLSLLGNHERINKKLVHYKPLNPIFESLDWINVNNRLIPVDLLSNLPIPVLTVHRQLDTCRILI